MDRRELLGKLLLSIPSISLLNTFFSSCKRDESLFEGFQYSGKVAIVGAGAAGLYAALLLKKYGASVQVFEASDKIGGRIQSQSAFADFDIELGAEKVKGKNSIWFDLLRNSVVTFAATDGLQEYAYIESTLLGGEDLYQDEDVIRLNNLVNSLRSYYDGDEKVSSYLDTYSYPDRILPLANAWIGNRYGTANSRLSILAIAQAEQLKAAGPLELNLSSKSFTSVLTEQFAEILDTVQLSTQITNIDYSGSQISLTDQNGNTYTADKVLVCVPLKVLKDSDIGFSPVLPSYKTVAMNSLEMDKSIRVVLKFSAAFWNENCSYIYGKAWFPEFFVSSAGKGSSSFVLSATVNGIKAEYLEGLGSDDAIIAVAVSELESMFGAGSVSTLLMDSVVKNWGQDPFIKGAYSYPTKAGDQHLKLSQPIDDRIYFAGEHTNLDGHFGTVHGALESAYRAVYELLETVKKN